MRGQVLKAVLGLLLAGTVAAPGAFAVTTIPVGVTPPGMNIGNTDYTKPIIDTSKQAKFKYQVINPLSFDFIYQPLSKASATQPYDFYQVSIRQFPQFLGLEDDTVTGQPKILTNVWGYGDGREDVTLTGVRTSVAGAAPHHYTGPTFEVRSTLPVNVNKGEKVRVQWLNGLTDADGKNLPHLLPLDRTIMCGPNAPACFPDARVVTHVHGSHVADHSDGTSEQWFSPNFAVVGTTYRDPFTPPDGVPGVPAEGIREYRNDQESCSLWYHDHATGITRLNIMAGLAGFHLLRDDREDALQASLTIPAYPFETALAIQDRTFFANGQIAVADKPLTDPVADPKAKPPVPAGPVVYDPAYAKPNPSIIPEFFGNTILVNGTIWPYMNVEARPYRVRLLNGSDSRTLVLQFRTPQGPRTAPPIWIIGSDRGLLNNPVPVTTANPLIIMPAERYDVVIDFSNQSPGGKAGSPDFGAPALVLENVGPDVPFDGTIPVPGNTLYPVAHAGTTGTVIGFNIYAAGTLYPNPPADFPNHPSVAKNLQQASLQAGGWPWPATPFAGNGINLRQQPAPDVVNPQYVSLPTVPAGSVYRNMKLEESTDEFGRLLLLLNGKGFFDPVTELPKLNATEAWNLFNLTPDAHPIHLHLVRFQVVSRTNFKVNQVTGLPVLDPQTGLPVLTTPDVVNPQEQGWKDTVVTKPGQMTEVVATFDIPGSYVWHCHILSHEEHSMMRPYTVVTPATGINVKTSVSGTTFFANSAPTVTFTASSDPDTDGFEYRFWVKDPVVGWEVKQPFSTSRTWTWTPPARAGLYGVLVDVRQIGSVAQREVYKQINYTLKNAGPTEAVSLTPSVPSPQAVEKQVTFFAGATGGSGAYEYQFWLKKNGAWAVVQPYSTASSWTWDTTGAASGDYLVAVYARNAGSTYTKDVSLGIPYSLK